MPNVPTIAEAGYPAALIGRHGAMNPASRARGRGSMDPRICRWSGENGGTPGRGGVAVVPAPLVAD